MTPKISVIIPVYNGEKTLEKCLNSVIGQTYPDFEIIIIDNASNDKTDKIIKYYRNNKIKYFYESKKGRGVSRKLGILKSSGDLIAMIDSDCIAPKNWLENISKPIIENSEKIVMGGEESIFENYYSVNIQKANEDIIERNRNGNYINHLDTKNIIFKKEIFNYVMFDPDLKSFEDFDFFIQIKDLYNIFYLPKVKVKHHHKINRREWVKTQIDRSFSFTKIYIKYKDTNNNLFNNHSLFNWIKLPFWLLIQLIKKPKNFPFIFWTEISWRIGIILYYFDKVGLYKYEQQ